MLLPVKEDDGLRSKRLQVPMLRYKEYRHLFTLQHTWFGRVEDVPQVSWCRNAKALAGPPRCGLPPELP